MQTLHTGARLVVWRPATSPSGPLSLADFARELCAGANPNACLPDLVNAVSESKATFDRVMSQPLIASRARFEGRHRRLILAFGPTNASGADFVALAEVLASHGYTVASVAARPGSISSYDQAKVAETLQDAHIAISLLVEHATTDEDIGVLAWSFGGVPALLLAMNDSRFQVFVSFDSAVRYAYGAALLREAPNYAPDAFNGLLLSVTPQIDNTVEKDDRILMALRNARIQTHLADGFRHRDFSDLHGALPALALPPAQAAVRRQRAARLFGVVSRAFSEF